MKHKQITNGMVLRCGKKNREKSAETDFYRQFYVRIRFELKSKQQCNHLLYSQFLLPLLFLSLSRLCLYGSSIKCIVRHDSVLFGYRCAFGNIHTLIQYFLLFFGDANQIAIPFLSVCIARSLLLVLFFIHLFICLSALL